jgi:hypothetical protein
MSAFIKESRGGPTRSRNALLETARIGLDELSGATKWVAQPPRNMSVFPRLQEERSSGLPASFRTKLDFGT